MLFISTTYHPMQKRDFVAVLPNNFIGKWGNNRSGVLDKYLIKEE